MYAIRVLCWTWGVALCLSAVVSSWGEEPPPLSLRVGWATADITPLSPASLEGFRGKRISTGVRDPLTATVLALESIGPDGQSVEQAILISCDLLWIRKVVQDAVAEAVATQLADVDPDKIVLNASHTHQGPASECGVYSAWQVSAEEQADGVITGDEYRQFLVERLTSAAVQAWEGRRAGGVSWALDQAVVGFNRRFVYFDGSARMLSNIATPEFDCIEGVEDHGLLLLFFWDPDGKLTGMVINVASPAQADQGGNRISADFWYDVREEIALRHGPEVFVLAQCGAAGDIYPQGPFRHRAEVAMAERRGITWRREIGRRIAAGVDRALSVAESHVDFSPTLRHTVVRIDLPQVDPSLAPFYQCDPVTPVVFHAMRLGDVALVTNPFEMFTDYGIRIQARSKALLTFVVQLARHHSGYLPTARAVAGGGYSADRYLVGPDGGRLFVDETVEAINALWP